MCVVSAVTDFYGDKWGKYVEQIPQDNQLSKPMSSEDFEKLKQTIAQEIKEIVKKELEDFKALVQIAREYDKQHNEPHCELEEKKQRILKLAEDLGVKIDFL